MDFCTESVKKQRIYNLLLLFEIYSLKMLKIVKKKIAPEQSRYNKGSFSVFGAHFDGRPKIATPRNFSKLLFGTKPYYKNLKV